MEKEKYRKFYDKVYGGWLGKCLGGAAGAPVEGIKRLITDIDYRDVIRPDLPNDDLDLQLLWLEVMEEKGLSHAFVCSPFSLCGNATIFPGFPLAESFI